MYECVSYTIYNMYGWIIHLILYTYVPGDNSRETFEFLLSFVSHYDKRCENTFCEKWIHNSLDS